MSNKFKPTASQKKAIEGKGSLLVSAAAGSGKTATLVDRVIKKLTDPDQMYKITDLLMVTFTKAAAAEMRSRISMALGEKLSQDISPSLRKHLREQTVLLPKADISTVDSFCKKLISDNFDALDLPPDFKIIPEPQLNIMKEQALSDTVEHFLTVRKKEFTALMKLLGTDSRLENIRASISQLYEYMQTLPFPEEWREDCIAMYRNFDSVAGSPWGQWILQSLYSRFNSTADLLQAVIQEISADEVLSQKRGGDLKEGLNFCLEMLDLIQGSSYDLICSKVQECQKIKWSKSLSKNDIYDPLLQEKTERAREKYHKTVEKAKKNLLFSEKDCKRVAKELTPFIELLFEAAEYYSELLREAKSEKNYLDFADIEHLTLKLLAVRENRQTTLTPLSLTVSQSFKEVLVDEYQDTNDLQDEIFRIISQNRKNLFCVGDVKQSIYGFRRSNPKNFLKLLESYSDYDGVSDTSKIILSENFRSRKGICDTVNFIFQKIMSRGCGDIDYDNTHMLNAAADFPERDMNDAEIDIINLSVEDERTPLQVEADRTAEIIREMMQKECISKGNGLIRPQYGDFCVLMRTVKDTAKPFADRLSEHGIPVSFSHSEDFFALPEVAKMLSVLKVISNPLDDVALLSAMMCPIFGFSADEAAAIRADCKKSDIYTALRFAANSGNKKAENFINTVCDLRKYAATHTVDRLISKIYDDFGLPEVYLTDYDGQTKRRNLFRLQELARDCVNDGYETNYEFLRFADKVQKGEIKLPSDSSFEQPDAVRIMSIHHSKGLQFPVVFLVGLTKQVNADTSAFQLDQKYGIGLKIYDPQSRKKTSTLMFEAVRSAKAKNELSELLRIYYVGATRPKDNLFTIICDSKADKSLCNSAVMLSSDYQGKNTPIDPILVEDAQNFSSLILYCALLHPEGKELRSLCSANFSPDKAPSGLTVRYLLSDSVEKSVKFEKEDVRPTGNWDEKELKKLKEALDFEYEYKALSSLAAKISVSALTHKSPSNSAFSLRPSFLQDNQLNSAEKGTAMHQFMQYADYISAQKDLENEISLLLEQKFISKVQADSLNRQRLRSFFESSLFERMCKSEKLLREQRFIIEIPAGRLDPNLPPNVADEPIAIQGIADCIFFENGQPVIVDYKTDRVDNEKILKERYAPQLEIYAEAFEKILGCKVKQKLLYSFSLSKTLEIV